MSPVSIGIAIPTYNRGAKIYDFLSKSIEELNQRNIQIFISDNCSTDSTKEIVNRYQDKYKNIHYACQKENVGFLKNFEYVLHWSDTDYVWLCGDDDLIDLKCLDLISERLENNLDLLVVNGGDYKNNSYRVPSSIKDKIYKNKDDVLGDLGYHMSWMSTLIFSKKMIQNISLLPYQWTAFPHLTAVFDYLSTRKSMKVGYISKPIVFYNSEGSTGNSYNDKLLLYFCDHWNEMCNHWSEAYTPIAVKRFKYGHRDNISDWNLKSFMNYRINVGFNYSIFKKYKEQLSIISKSNILLIGIVSILPILPLKIAKRLYKLIK